VHRVTPPTLLEAVRNRAQPAHLRVLRRDGSRVDCIARPSYIDLDDHVRKRLVFLGGVAADGEYVAQVGVEIGLFIPRSNDAYPNRMMIALRQRAAFDTTEPNALPPGTAATRHDRQRVSHLLDIPTSSVALTEARCGTARRVEFPVPARVSIPR